MTYAVVWSVFSIQETNRVERSFFDPERVRASIARIDHFLRRIPHNLGESREPGFRLWYEDVLGVFYRVDDAAMTVEVLYAGPSRRRP